MASKVKFLISFAASEGFTPSFVNGFSVKKDGNKVSSLSVNVCTMNVYIFLPKLMTKLLIQALIDELSQQQLKQFVVFHSYGTGLKEF